MLCYEALREKVYAGVLGKLIGVYLGRPVEGWSYEQIQQQFGNVYHYVHRQVGVPLIVADDDISGTFGFFRAMEDYGYPTELTAAQIGETWRNYIIEDKTILWWGGLGRSTEHTAYLNLKQGIPAPLSGSMHDIWDLHPRQLQMWTSSAKNFAPDMEHTFCVSHPEENGLATIGTDDWTDYTVSSRLSLGLSKAAGLVLRCKGHRQYYGAALTSDQVLIFAMIHGIRKTLVSTPFKLKSDHPYEVAFSCNGPKLNLQIDGRSILEAVDHCYTRGGCGFFVDKGAMLVDNFRIRAKDFKAKEQ